MNYFLMKQAKINEDFKFLIKKYSFDNFYIIVKEAHMLNFEYDFVNFGRVLQYVANYKSILNNVLKNTKQYILFSGTIFFEDTQKNDIIVKQINMWPNKTTFEVEKSINYEYFSPIVTGNLGIQENIQKMKLEKQNY